MAGRGSVEQRYVGHSTGQVHLAFSRRPQRALYDTGHDDSVITRILLAAAGVILLTAAAPPVFDRSVARVHARPGHANAIARTSSRAARTRCVGIDHVAGAVVFGDRAVELSMTDGSHWRMGFAAACPALGFYSGFYYRRAVAGRLCAGRDAVIARSGGSCPITSIVRIPPPSVTKTPR